MFRLRSAFVFLLLFPAFSARADWEMTKWHMTKKQIATSGLPPTWQTTESEKKAFSDNRGGVAELSFRYNLNGIGTIGYLLFNKNGLSSVKLVVQNKDDLQAMRRYLVRKHGDPGTQDYKSVEGCETISYGFSGENELIVYYSRTCQGEANFMAVVEYCSSPP